jgi:hypothetical protein
MIGVLIFLLSFVCFNNAFYNAPNPDTGLDTLFPWFPSFNPGKPSYDLKKDEEIRLNKKEEPPCLNGGQYADCEPHLIDYVEQCFFEDKKLKKWIRCSCMSSYTGKKCEGSLINVCVNN